MNVFGQYERDSWLRRRNPTAKLVAHLMLALLLTVVFDPVTPLAFLAAAVLVGKVLGDIPPWLLLRSLAPIWLLGLSLVASNALFARQGAETSAHWSLGPVTMTLDGALLGLSLAERGVAIAGFTLLVVMTTGPEELVRSLVQQAHAPARFAYAMLAAYRMVPLLAEEWETIRLAHRLRGYGLNHRFGAVGRVRDQAGMLLPLLTNAIRRADRVALAMDSRGFGASERRTHYRRVPFGAADVWLVLAAVTGGVGLLLVSAELGILETWSGGFP
ncbi:MAG: energy-coupling factor transporter transmembrane protein EcfT [Chloroflexia bacterium]|nr:energy-coupling factor transporter transmembrane protein EcfT [Chloroflexia bacterium]